MNKIYKNFFLLIIILSFAVPQNQKTVNEINTIIHDISFQNDDYNFSVYTLENIISKIEECDKENYLFGALVLLELLVERAIYLGEENLLYEDQSLQLTELKTKIFEYDQKIQLRNELVKSLKDKIEDLKKNTNNLEKNNNELLKSIELNNIKIDEYNSIKMNELDNFQKTIKILKQDAQKQNKNILLFEKKNIELNSQIQILNDRINRLEFQKNAISKEIKNLQNNISGKEKIIENLKDKLHH